MRTKGCFNWTYIAIAAIAISVAACGNSQKKKEKERDQAKQTAIQPQDSVTIIESETVIVAVDSIAPDSAAMKQKAPTPKKTK